MDSLERIARAAEHHDGAAPLDEATLRLLEHHPERARVILRDGGLAVVADGELRLVVHPEARGRGVGRSLLVSVLGETPGPLSAWSHGHHPAAAALASAYGFDRVRDLWVMRRSAALPLAPVQPGPGVSVRSFAPGDEAAVLRINAAAFAHHPEQGSMDAAELAERMAQPWFDPAGLLIASVEGTVAGFHWTKRHSPTLGEVYVVGVDPAAQGHGLGKVLTLAGLHHLHDGGAREVLLYVESDNAPAVAVYSSLGFTHAAADTHVMYLRPAG
ncbi:MAG: mycothiol synthase [Actinobacteria bacterium]|uniref:Unannotated protein n=1 Tax=freshwater metagenome TaxID=449393 RepID=A0A6J6S4P6_9ZZZZ|nr:mycothiol synthase [Actinomycetota bacterium]